MPRLVVINSSNFVSGSGNTFTYNIPQTFKSNAGDMVGVASISMYNSTFNIRASVGNNIINLTWNANTITNYTFVVPDGYYSISDLNFWLQSQMILNNLYVSYNAGANYAYFAEFQINSVRYSVSTNVYALPLQATATTLGYTIPSGATWSFPTGVAKCPQLTFNKSFGALIGQLEGTFPSTVLAVNTQYLSSITPTISPINSNILTCNLVNSPFSILYTYRN